MEYYAIYDQSTGAIQSRSCVPDGTVAGMTLPDGLGVMVMPYGAFEGIVQDDLGPLRQAVVDQINTAAGAFRKRFITDIPGQQATYLAKETEAKAWTAGAKAADFPYLSAEASATGRTIGAVVALVLATAERWRALDPRIEGLRRGATVAIDAARDMAAIVRAGSVDWDGLLAPQPITEEQPASAGSDAPPAAPSS